MIREKRERGRAMGGWGYDVWCSVKGVWHMVQKRRIAKRSDRREEKEESREERVGEDTKHKKREAGRKRG